MTAPSSAYQTFALRQKPDQLIKTVCEEVGCQAFEYGWRTVVDEATPIGETQARYIRRQSRRTFREQRDGQLTVFTFDPGQRCFAEHHTNPQRFLVVGGRTGALNGTIREHARGVDWVEHFNEHQQGIADRLAQG